MDHISGWRRDPEGLLPLVLLAGPGQDAGPLAILTAMDPDRYGPVIGFTGERVVPDSAYWQLNPARLLRPGFAKRGYDHLQTLAVLGVDCDYRDAGEAAELVARTVPALAEMNAPPVSWWLSSGQGIWAFWMLRHPDHPDLPLPLMPLRSTPREEALRDYGDIVRKLGAQLKGYGIPFDSACTDPCRLSRIPGTVNAKSGRVVKWQPIDLERRYSLDEFGMALMGSDWQSRALSNSVPKTPPPARGEGGISGTRLHTVTRLQRQNCTRLRVLLELQRRRPGHPREGDRHNAILALATFALRAGYSESKAVQIAGALAAGCSPPESQRVVEYQVRDIYKHRERTLSCVPFSNATIASWFGVSVEDVDGIAGGASGAWRNRRRRAMADGAARNVWEARSKRRRILHLLNTRPGLARLSCRSLREAARDYEIHASHETCRKALEDYHRHRGESGGLASAGPSLDRREPGDA